MTKVKTVADLVHDRRNPRKHNERNLKVIVDSLYDVGFARSIVIDENNEILAGNGVTEAAVLAGIEKVVEVEADGNTIIAVRRTGLSDEQKQRLKYFDNRSGELAGWDAEVLLADLQSGVDLSGMFNQDELDALLDGLAEKEQIQDAGAQVDKAAELQAKWQTQTGQLWQLGRHKIACGDCTDKATVERLMMGERANGMMTDPPYGVDYTGGTGSYAGGVIKSKTRKTISNDFDPSLYKTTFEIADKYIDSGPVYVWYADKLIRHIAPFIPENFELRTIINWYKINQGFGDMGADYHNVSEPMLYFVKGKANFIGPNNEKNVWELQRPQSNDLHPTQKPLELICKALGNHNADVILEPFAGSGTTLIACEQLNRQCRAVEISPAYCAVILERFYQSTNELPVLIPDSQ